MIGYEWQRWARGLLELLAIAAMGAGCGPGIGPSMDGSGTAGGSTTTEGHATEPGNSSGEAPAESTGSGMSTGTASTGSSAGELTQTSVHLHIHAIPLYLPDDKPADIFSWTEGVYVAERDEWEELRAQYREAWGHGPAKAGGVGS